MTRPRLTVALALVTIAIALMVWRCGSGGDPARAPATPGSAVAAGSARSRVVAPAPRPDPRTLGRGSIAGTITVDDATKAPIANAQVCAYGTSHTLATELLRMPACAPTDALGRYTIANLLPAEYRLAANARTYRPEVFRPGGDRRRVTFHLAANETRTGADIALRTGGVEITGTVVDLTGGTIAKASVWAGEYRNSTAIATESDEQGRFALWVAPGWVQVRASADGYDDNEEGVDAPGQNIEVVLTPESTLAGKVVDAASGEPVEGARVNLSEWTGAESVFTDAQGVFRIRRLAPGRQTIYARTDRAYGRSEGSVLIGLGENVDGVVVKLHPAAKVSGTVVIAGSGKPCEVPEVSLRDKKSDRWISLRRDAGGTLWAEGVLPGDYEPSLSCQGYQAREKYDRVLVADKDVTGLVWEVDPGATIRGKVLARSGAPIEDAEVFARTTGGAAREKTGWGGDESSRDGTYELTGLKPGSYRVEVRSERGVPPKDDIKVDVAAGATVEKNLILDDVGTIKGVVVDAEGRPVTKINASAYLVGGGGQGWGDRPVDDAGAFTIEGLRPGEYRVTAQRNWTDTLRKPGTTDDAKQGEKTIVRANQITTVRLVVESLAGTIKGTVVDVTGQPVGDAFISTARESDAAGAQKTNVQETRWSWGDKPVLTGVDGAFVVDKLAPGTYTVRAFRRGGGEAIAEHVAVGGTTKLQIKPTGSIRGVVKRAPGDTAPITELEVTAQDRKLGFWRSEEFFMTEGRFHLADLPQGTFDLTALVAGSRKVVPIQLAEGEQKDHVVIELEGLVSLRGRLVEHGTTKPVPGIRMGASPLVGGGRFGGWGNSDDPNVTDESGAFVIEDAPSGRVRISGFPKDWNSSDYVRVDVVRTPSAGGDLGDVPIFRRRVKRGDAVGELGVNFASQPNETLPDQRELKVSWIDPQGPAAKTELKVGDLVTTVDGVDVAGANSTTAWSLLRAAPGTKVTLGLARGATVAIVLAAP